MLSWRELSWGHHQGCRFPHSSKLPGKQKNTTQLLNYQEGELSVEAGRGGVTLAHREQRAWAVREEITRFNKQTEYTRWKITTSHKNSTNPGTGHTPPNSCLISAHPKHILSVLLQACFFRQCNNEQIYLLPLCPCSRSVPCGVSGLPCRIPLGTPLPPGSTPSGGLTPPPWYAHACPGDTCTENTSTGTWKMLKIIWTKNL